MSVKNIFLGKQENLFVNWIHSSWCRAVKFLWIKSICAWNGLEMIWASSLLSNLDCAKVDIFDILVSEVENISSSRKQTRASKTWNIKSSQEPKIIRNTKRLCSPILFLITLQSSILNLLRRKLVVLWLEQLRMVDSV